MGLLIRILVVLTKCSAISRSDAYKETYQVNGEDETTQILLLQSIKDAVFLQAHILRVCSLRSIDASHHVVEQLIRLFGKATGDCLDFEPTYVLLSCVRRE